MNILFRVDAGDGIGLGHFARSVALAHELKQRGHFIHFVCKKSAFWTEKINSGFPWKVSFLDETNQETALVQKEEFDLLYVDGNISYSAEESAQIKRNVPICMYQNLTDAKVFADVYILPSIHQGDRFFEDFEPSTKVYQGLSYFTFNQSLYSLRSVEVHAKLKRIGVVSGGSDPKNILVGVYQLINQLRDLDSLNFVFFVGESYLHPKSLPTSTPLRSFVPFDYTSITSCDLVICAFGVSTYEMMALGIPVISVGHQQSTSEAAQYLADHTGSIYHLGLYDDVQGADIQSAIEKLSNEQVRKSYREKAKAVVDLNGIQRVVKIIETHFNAA